jgi:hypothetical protein
MYVLRSLTITSGVCCKSLPSLAQARGRGGFAPYGSIVAGASQFDVAAQPNLCFHFLGIVICIVLHRQPHGIVVCVDVCIVVCVVASVIVVCVVTHCLCREVVVCVLVLLFALRHHCFSVPHRLRHGVIVCIAASLSASRHCCQHHGVVLCFVVHCLNCGVIVCGCCLCRRCR